MTDDQHGEGTPQGGGRWDPLPQGDYDDGATAFVKLPEGGVDALLASADSPLAAPGHGYVPPQITVSPTAAPGTDPGTGSWSTPGAPVDGAQWGDPNGRQEPNAGGYQHGSNAGGQPYGSHPGAQPHAANAGTGQPHAPHGAAQPPHASHAGAQQAGPRAGDPSRGGHEEHGGHHEGHGGHAGHEGHAGRDRFEYHPGATGQWNFQEAPAPESDPAAAAPGHDVTGQWSIPVAGGDLPDESGEFTTSSLVEQWGGTPPATLPGGAPAPWAPQAAGAPWGEGTPGGGGAGQQTGTPQQPTGADQTPERPGGAGHAPGHDTRAGQPQERPAGAGHTQDQDPGAGQLPDQPWVNPHGPGEHSASGHPQREQDPSERTYGEHGPSERTYGEQGPSERTYGEHGPPERTYGEHGPSGHPHGAPGPDPHASGRRQADPAREQPADPYAEASPEPVPYREASPEPTADARTRSAPGTAEAPEAAEDSRRAREAAERPAGPAAEPAGAGETEAGPKDAQEPVTAASSGTEDTPTAHASPGASATSQSPQAPSDPAHDPASAPPPEPGTDPAHEGDAPSQEPAPAGPQEEHPLASYVLRVNGVDRPVTDAWIGESLLYVLRERLGLAGAKDGCSQGECGACNVQVDGRLVASCLAPAVTAAGSEVRTVEGLAADGQPSDVQRALARCGAVQCGFCVPGMAMTVHDLLEGNPAPTELETRQALCGNLCRCSGYRGVVEAVKEVVAEREAHAGADTPEADADEARIPHQAGPGAGGVHPSAFESSGSPGSPGAPGSPEGPGPHGPHDQPYGQDGGHA